MDTRSRKLFPVLDLNDYNTVIKCSMCVTGKGGQFAVLTSSNRLFYGTITSGMAMEVYTCT